MCIRDRCEDGDAARERQALRCEAGGAVRQEEEDHPGQDEAGGDRDCRAHHDSEQYCEWAHETWVQDDPAAAPHAHLMVRTGRSSLARLQCIEKCG